MKRSRPDVPARIRNQFGTFAQIPSDLVKDPAISDRAVRVYALLWDYSNEKSREAFPSRTAMAADLEVSVSTIDRGIGELVRRGAITVDETYAGDRQTSNLYTIVAPLPPRPATLEVIHRGRKFAAPPAANLKPPGAANLRHQEQEPEEQEIDLVPEVTTDARNEAQRAGSTGDGQGSPPATPKNLARLRGHGISTPDIFSSVGEWLAPTHIDDEGLEMLAGWILSKASTRVVNPTAYVIEAFRNPATRSEWVAAAWEAAAVVHLRRVDRKAAG